MGAKPQPERPRAKKLTYAEQIELAGMEASVLEAEERLAAASGAAEDPAVASDAMELQARWAAVAAAQS